MGAIVLWLIFLGGLYIYPVFITVILMAITAWLLNSQVKIRHL